MFCILRFLIGWQELKGHRQNSIGVFVHTSYWDAFIFWLYSHDACAIAITKPQFFTWYLRPILKALGFISAPRLEDRGQGGLQFILEQIRDTQAFKQGKPLTVAISPKGTIYQKPWRTGYKAIAKELHWPIRPVIIDYLHRKLEILDPIDASDPNLDTKLLLALKASVPYNPQFSDVETLETNTNRHIIDYVMFSNTFMVPSLIKGLFLKHYGSLFWGFLSVSSSFAYHWSVETKFNDYDRLFARIIISWFLYWYALKSSLLCRIAFVSALCCFFKASGRRHSECRSPRYSFWHTLFHCLIGLASYTALEEN